MPLPTQNTCAVKRKKPNDKGSEFLGLQATSTVATHQEGEGTKLRQKLHRALKGLCRVVKKARTFEVQRTLRKLKEARCKDPESDVTRDLEAQMEIFKHLSCDQLAQLALATKLNKDRTLSANPTIQAVSREMASNLVPPEASGTPTARVRSRILSSKVLASEVISIVETLRTFLRPAVESGVVEEATSNAHTSPDTSKKRRIGASHEKDAFPSKDHAVDPSGYENTSGNEAVGEVGDGWKSGTVEAPSESDDASSENMSGEANLASEGLKNTVPLSRTQVSMGQSEFLPSLSVGFTRGDSGSEFSDSEAKLVEGIKKNRRGQRARRAIWEKKFGKYANHIQKQEQQGTEWSVPVDRRSGKGNTSTRPRGLTPMKHSRQRKGENQVLHPSWEAKRKQKSANIVPSQGTKIVFSES